MEIRIERGLPDGAMEVRRAVFVCEQGLCDAPDEIDKTAHHALVILDGAPIATCRLFCEGADAGIYTLGRFAVIKEHRGRGIGRKMLTETEEAARRLGAREIVLHAQATAMEFYKRCGYEEFGEREQIQGVLHVMMRKSLCGNDKPPRRGLKAAFLATLPVMAGYLVLGCGFGMIAEGNGYGILWSVLMSILIYAGSMQYVTVSLLASGAGLISAAITTLMVNARHLFYGISTVSKYRGTGAAKPYLIFGLTDETYSLISGEEGGAPDFKRYALLVTVLNHAYWVIGTAIGAAIGTLIPFDLRGIDFAMTALFITIYVEQWLTAKNKLAHIIGAGASLICLLIFGADGFLIPSMLAISTLTFIFRRFIDTKDAKEAEK